jgi:hypothetical protein
MGPMSARRRGHPGTVCAVLVAMAGVVRGPVTAAAGTTVPAPVCGDGVVQRPETCDDGNTKDESTPGYDPLPPDRCPVGCIIEKCTPSGARKAVDVNLVSSVPVGAIKVFLDYPEGRVSLPDVGNEPLVTERISNVSAGMTAVANDLDYGLIEVLGGSAAPISTPRLFTVTFDTCAGAPAVTAADFVCSVKSAADTSGNDLDGVSCSVVVP